MALRGIVDQYDRDYDAEKRQRIIDVLSQLSIFDLSMFGELDVSTNMTLKMR